MSPGRLIVIGRILLLALAAAAVALSLAFGHGERIATLHRRYVCPMHPEVTSAEAGQCPICRMALELTDGIEPMTPSDLGARRSSFGAATLRTFNQEIRAAAWVEADGLVLAVFYRDEIEALARAEDVSFWPAKNESSRRTVRLAPDPIVTWDRSTSLVPFRFDPISSALRRGQIGWVVLPARPRELLVVSSNAVIDSPEGPYVIGPASKDGRSLAKRPVELGRVFNGVAVVMSGLRVGEPVVVADTFFLDAERRLRADRDPSVKGMP